MKHYIKYLVLLFLAIGLILCEKTTFAPEPGKDPEAVFETLWTSFQNDYAGFDQRHVNWQEQYQRFRPQVSANTTDDALANTIEAMLSTLGDGHVELIRPNRRIFYANKIVNEEIDNELFNLELIKTHYLQDVQSDYGGGIVYGKIGSLGYIHLKYIGLNLLALDEALDYLDDVEGLIFDLRHNGGGDFTYAYSEFGRLTNQERFVHRSQTKNGTGHDDYTPWYDWNIHPKGKYFDKPIVLLTDRYTISAGERMTMAFKSLPNVLHLGDTTNGAFSTKILKELPNGWVYSVATQHTEFLDGKSYEGIGMIPDEVIRNTKEEVDAKVDHQLEVAIQRF